MGVSQQEALRKYRQRLNRQGLRRVEVLASDADAALLRQAAQMLRDSSGDAARLRSTLRQAVSEGAVAPDFKKFLEQAPLEEIDLTRPRDLGREVDL